MVWSSGPSSVQIVISLLNRDVLHDDELRFRRGIFEGQ